MSGDIPYFIRDMMHIYLQLYQITTFTCRCKDYPGIQFTKKLSRIQNETIKRAEVAAWFRNFDEAEKLFLEVDRRDLAVAMRKRLGDWFKVVQLLKTGSGGNDAEMEEAFNEVCHLYSC